MTDPTPKLDSRFSDPEAGPTSWSDTARVLEAAELYWLTTVRADGRPHVTPLIGVAQDGAMHFCTGLREQKARNLDRSSHVALTTGNNTWAARTRRRRRGDRNPDRRPRCAAATGRRLRGEVRQRVALRRRRRRVRQRRRRRRRVPDRTGQGPGLRQGAARRPLATSTGSAASRSLTVCRGRRVSGVRPLRRRIAQVAADSGRSGRRPACPGSRRCGSRPARAAQERAVAAPFEGHDRAQECGRPVGVGRRDRERAARLAHAGVAVADVEHAGVARSPNAYPAIVAAAQVLQLDAHGQPVAPIARAGHRPADSDAVGVSERCRRC